MASVKGDLDTLKTIVIGLLENWGKGSKTANELQALLDAAGSVRNAISKPEFQRRSDAIRIQDNVANLTKAANLNLQELQFLIYPKFSRSGKSPKAELEDPLRSRAIGDAILKHTGAYQRLADYIAGREDWSKLAPKAPRAPSVSPDSATRLAPAENDKISISVPASPFQPTVENVTDDEEEEEVIHNVEHYNFVSSENTGSAEASRPNPRRVPSSSTPPQVIIRQATDPKAFESPKRKPEPSASPLRSFANLDLDDGERGPSRPADENRHLDPSALPRIVTQVDKPAPKSLRDLEDEIARLQAEVKRFSATETQSIRPRSSRDRRSVDLDRVDDYPGSDGSRRPRASTTAGSERPRPRSFVEGSTYDPYRSDMPPPPRPDILKRNSSHKSRRHPSRSPRTPFSATDSQLDAYNDHDAYAADPRTSLPTLSERDSRQARSSRLGHRRKESAPTGFDDGNFYDHFKDADGNAADAPLFGPGPSSYDPQSARARSRANSRAKDPSPNSKPYISPRQLHESPPVEPNVRDLKVSLEDVFYGTTKRFKVRRQLWSARTGAYMDEERVLEVPINPGLKPGSKIKFEGAGDQTPEGTRELHFKLVERDHEDFRRVDYDLHTTFELTLLEALCGWERKVTSICGKEIKFSHPGPTPAKWQDDRAGLGMCKFRDPNERGDLIADVLIKYPANPLTGPQKQLLRQALGGQGASPRGSGFF